MRPSRQLVGRYLTTYLLDRAADGLFFLALGWLAAQASGGLGAASIIAAGSVPRVVMMLLGGAVGDRWGLVATARLTLFLRIALFVVFAFAAMPQKPTGWLLAAAAALFGLVDALHMPAVTGIAGVMVRGPEQVRLQGAMGSIGNTMEILAAPTAGLLLGWRGDSVGWVGAALSIVALIALPPVHMTPAHGEESDSTVMQQVREVLSLALRDHALRAMLTVFAVANLAATPAIVVGIPLLAVAHGWPAHAYGVVLAGFAAGSVVGGLLLAKWGQRFTHPARWALGTMLPGASGIAFLSGTSTIPAATAATVLIGSTFALGAGALVGTIMAATPPHAMGRMISLRMMAVYSLIPLGLVAFGALAEIIGVQRTELTMAVALALTAIVGLVVGPLRTLTLTPAQDAGIGVSQD